MRELDELTITDEVLARLADTPDPRVRQVSQALVRHLHAFLREIEPTQEEWEKGIAFLTQAGQISDEKRKEFILLSDVLGASTLVDSINHRMPEGATQTTVLGPFFVGLRREFARGDDIAPGIPGTPLHVSGSIRSTSGKPLAGASVDVWHSDEEGFYDVQNRDGFSMRGRFFADSLGRFYFRTVRPRFYPIPDDGPVGDLLKAQGRHPFRPEHIHFLIAADGHETLITHLFAEGDPYLDSDVVFGVKESLIVRYETRDEPSDTTGAERREAGLGLHHDFVLKPGDR